MKKIPLKIKFKNVKRLSKRKLNKYFYYKTDLENIILFKN